MEGSSFFKKAAALTALIPALSFGFDSNLSPAARTEAAFVSVGSRPESIAYLEEQAARNNPYAYFYLGVALELGRGVHKNHEMALEHYRVVAEKVKEAAFNAARLHYRAGRTDEALSYFVLAAGGEKVDGNERAMVMLGRIYESDGNPTNRNYIAAARWYEAAARRRDPVAVGKMGEFLLYGLGRQINTRDAKIYLERAADMWNPESQYLLGEMFSKGMGVPVNKTEAGKWFLVAASHSADYQKRSKNYLSGLSPMESGSAQRMAELWISAHAKPSPIDYLGIIDRIR